MGGHARAGGGEGMGGDPEETGSPPRPSAGGVRQRSVARGSPWQPPSVTTDTCPFPNALERLTIQCRIIVIKEEGSGLLSLPALSPVCETFA